MIGRSFVMLPGIGVRTEGRIWSQGIESWQGLIDADKVDGISARRLTGLKESSSKIIDLISSSGLKEIASLLPRRELWRVLGSWDERFAALDIEAVFSGGRFCPVVVSLKRGWGETVTFVRGDGLCWRALGEALDGVDFLVTFNGSSFDLPVLERNGYELGELLHIDLRRFSARVNLKGGLKEIERCSGILRSRELEYSTSEQVSYLWKSWERRGSKNALDLLIRYNRQDVDSLPELATRIYGVLSERVPCRR